MWGTLLQQDETPIVTNSVVVETTALVQLRLGIGGGPRAVGDILPALDVHWIDEDDHKHAQNALLAADRRKVSLVDCEQLPCCKKPRGTHCVCFDPHSREQGFEVLPSPANRDDEHAPTKRFD